MTDTIQQPYKSWKGASGQQPVWNSAVPSNSRPSQNGSFDNAADYQSPFGTARPLKIWRKQLVPPKPTYSSIRKVTIDQVTAPGVVVATGSTSECHTCAGDGNIASVRTLIQGNEGYLTTQTPNTLYLNAEKITDVDNNEYGKCISCDPVSNVIKSGSTLLRKNYYTSTSAYLQARSKTYKQMSTTLQRAGVNYLQPDGTPAWPSNSSTGSQVFNTPNCSTQCANNTPVTTIYKPNNVNFGVQGAVSSSTRLMRLKLNTVNKNGASFASAYGQAAANAGSYSANPTAPYFIKSKVNNCNRQTYYRIGNRTMCYTS